MTAHLKWLTLEHQITTNMKKQLLFLGALALSCMAQAQTITDTVFYTGSYDSIVVQCFDSIEFVAYGASGVDGEYTGGTGGLGAMAGGKLAVNGGDVIYFFAGGQE